MGVTDFNCEKFCSEGSSDILGANHARGETHFFAGHRFIYHCPHFADAHTGIKANAKQNRRIIDLPVRYQARAYGETNIQRWRHGLLLLKMVVVAARKIKFI